MSRPFFSVSRKILKNKDYHNMAVYAIELNYPHLAHNEIDIYHYFRKSSNVKLCGVSGDRQFVNIESNR